MAPLFTQEYYMRLALAATDRAEALGEVPIAAMILDAKNRTILSIAHNETRLRPDPTAHAEILVLRQAAQRLGTERLETCDIFVTLEPCPMCAQAIASARIRRLYFGAYDMKGGGVESGPRIFTQSSCFHRPEYYGGILEKECSRKLKHFFSRLRRSPANK